MLQQPPRLSLGFLIAFLAIICYGTAKTMDGGMVQFSIGSASFLLGVWSVVYISDWAVLTAIVRYKAYKEAAIQTPETRYLQALEKVQEFQLDFARAQTISMVGLPGSTGPLYTLEVDGEKIPLEFIQTFVCGGGDGEYLRPVRIYPDKTPERGWAQAITAHLVSQGFAEAANGNHPARWVSENSRTNALTWLGVGGIDGHNFTA